MSIYTVKTVKGVNEKFYHCDGLDVTVLPESGYYKDHPEVIGLPSGQKARLDLMNPDEKGNQNITDTLYTPKHGVIYIINNSTGKTIDRYPKERKKKDFRVVEKEAE